MPISAALEKEYQAQGFQYIAGLDEVGKGAWAGPMLTAAVILPEQTKLPGLNDSKLLSAKIRERLFYEIIEQAVAYAIGWAEPNLIDTLGLGKAHQLAMRQAVENLVIKPDFLLVDGLGIKQLGVETLCIIKGDQKVRCIAAASIIAKVTRDKIMRIYEEEIPGYGFGQHKGYGTAVHQAALKSLGISAIHRRSYQPIKEFFQETLFS